MWQKMVVDISEFARSGIGRYISRYWETDENYVRQQLGESITGMNFVPRDLQTRMRGYVP